MSEPLPRDRVAPVSAIGNDVVDLRDAESAERSLHPRFDERVFTAAERSRLAATADRGRLRWILWAAKEAAYKAARKIDPAVPFSPRRFEVDAEGRSVRWRAGELALLVDLDDDRVHVVASSERDAGGTVQAVAPAGDPDPRRAVRRLAERLLRGALDARRGPIVFRSDRRVPFAFRDGRRLPVDLSFSHHGRFVAVAAGRIDPR